MCLWLLKLTIQSENVNMFEWFIYDYYYNWATSIDIKSSPEELFQR